ncbi:hypothetical protein [Streptomyces abikoensis]|uniref:hypothetical protein n=1 Tax=Streptomyces abikoensis TaxID=97398 RepID=UPI0033E0F92A
MTLTDHDVAEVVLRGKPDHDLLRFLDRIPELDVFKIELIDGEIVIQASAAPLDNSIVSKLVTQFDAKWLGGPR